MYENDIKKVKLSQSRLLYFVYISLFLALTEKYVLACSWENTLLNGLSCLDTAAISKFTFNPWEERTKAIRKGYTAFY